MLKANIEAAIEAKEKEREANYQEIMCLTRITTKLKNQMHTLLDKDTDLYYEIEELKEQLNE